MTSARGISRQVILCSSAALIVLAMLFAARFAYSATSAGGTIDTSPTSVSAPSGVSTASPPPTNVAQNADTYCAQFEYPLACGQPDPKTQKRGGQGCKCTTGKLAGGITFNGQCVSKGGVGVCQELSQTADNSGTTGASSGSGSTTKPPSGGTTGGGTGGTTGTGGSTGSTAGTGTGSSGSGTTGSGSGTTGTGGSTGSGSATGGSAGSGTSGSTGGVYTGGGGNSGVLTGTGAWNSGSQYSGSGKYSRSGSVSPISAISSFVSGLSQIQSFTNNQVQVVPTGNNWSSVARQQNGMTNAYYLTPPTVNVTNYYQSGYEGAPSGVYGSTTGTFTAYDSSYSDRAAETGLRQFIDSVRKASNSAVTGLGNTYHNLTELPGNSSIDPTGVTGSNSDNGNPVFDTGIAPQNSHDNASASQNAVDSIQSMTDVEAAKSIAQEVRNNLEELRMTVKAMQQENSTHLPPQSNATSTAEHAKVPPVIVPGNATSSTAKENATSSVSSPESMQADQAVSAIDAAERRVENIQGALDAGAQKLSESNARVRELTAELNALNDRIKAGNQQLSDPTLSQSDQLGLLSALIENVQLALSDAEARLEQAVAKSPPPTVGHVAISGFGGAVSGAVDVTVQISLTFTRLIQNFWHAIFPSY